MPKSVVPSKGSVVRVGRMMRVPKALVNGPRLERDLTVSNGAYWSAVQNGSASDQSPELILFEDHGDTYLVPRHYKPQWRRRPIIVKKNRARQDAVIRHSIKLRTKDDAQEKGSKALLRDTNDKIISLACGKGKTVVSLFAASEGWRFPVLVIVPSEALMGGWKREILKCYPDLKESDIGHVQAGRSDWKGKKVALAMLHSMVLKAYPKAFYKYWRLVIFDECHRLGAEFFAKACPMFPGERWGLSATPNRTDGMDKVFKLHLGNVEYVNLKKDLKSTIFFVHTGVTCDTRRFMFRRGRINMAQLLNWLCDNDERNKLIAHYIEKAASRGRTILTLGERRRQLYDLCEALTSTDSKAVYVGTTGKKARAERENDLLTKRVLYATQHLAKEGLDKKELDTLFILATFGGHGRLQQSVGRIERICEGKQDPYVLVFVDDIGIMESLGNKMRNWLERNRYKIVDIHGYGKKAR